MTTPPTPPADAVARLTAQMLDPWERVRCLPRCRSDEPMNHGECDCGSQQFVSDIRTLLAAYADAARDRERLIEDEARMEWLEQSRMGPMDAADLITEWRWNGKRYAGGLRSAVDAAMEKERAARTGEAR